MRNDRNIIILNKYQPSTGNKNKEKYKKQLFSKIVGTVFDRAS